jgi:hypothetical protein
MEEKSKRNGTKRKRRSLIRSTEKRLTLLYYTGK